MNTRMALSLLFLVMAAAIAPAAAQTSSVLTTSKPPAGTIPLSVENEVRAAVNRGLDWLAAQQKENGSWSNEKFPALTALAMQAFIHTDHPARKEAISRAVTFLRGFVREDGGIYGDVPGQKGGGLSNYNTAICMTALHAVGDASLAPIIQKARAFVAGSQHLGGDVYDGGFGYDRSTGRAYTDLLNTYYAVTAMRETQDVEDLRPAGEKRVDIDWKATVKFVERMQNRPASGEEDAGGFTYNPTDPKAGTHTNDQGVVFFRSYGSITYAGLLALIYANVDKNDPRVLSALDWTARHWSLEENPGMGQEGLFFFYNVLTKALNAAGRDIVVKPEGEIINWRHDLAKRLVSLQKIEPQTGRGYWLNETGRFWESDPVLTTAYTLTALQMALGR